MGTKKKKEIAILWSHNCGARPQRNTHHSDYPFFHSLKIPFLPALLTVVMEGVKLIPPLSRKIFT